MKNVNVEPTTTLWYLARQMQSALEMLDYREGKYFLYSRHTRILHQELDHPGRLSSKVTTGKLYVSDSVDGLTIPKNEAAKMKGQL